MRSGNAASLRRQERLDTVRRLYQEHDYTIKDVAEILEVSESSVMAYRKELGLTKKIGEHPLCQFEGCNRPYCAKGWCNTHWAQMNRHGKVWAIVTDETPEERFWRFTDRKSDSECWSWLGPETGKFAKSDNTQGYGQLWYGGKKWMAHRFSYVLHNDVVLDSHITLDHLCRNKMCVNPLHLDQVTRRENIKRMHAYYSMSNEIIKLRKLVVELGGDPGYYEIP